MNAFRSLVFTGLMAVTMGSAPAVAQPQQRTNCGPYTEVVKLLQQRYGEDIVAIGIVDGGAVMMQILASPKTGSWTMLMVNVSDTACITASGEDYATVTKKGGI